MHTGIIRLVNGAQSPGYWSGRVEVFYNEEWGTVCDDYFGLEEAQVICRELGFFKVEAINTSAAYGQGRGRIWLNGLGCTGNEQSVFNCTHRPLGDTYGCGHNEDVGIACSNGENESDSHVHTYVCS